MNKKNLREYIGIVYDMEKSVYSQEKLIEKLNNEVEKLGIIKYEKPKYLKKSEVILSVFGTIIGAIVGFWVFDYIKSDTEGITKWIIVFLGGMFSLSFFCWRNCLSFGYCRC